MAEWTSPTTVESTTVLLWDLDNFMCRRGELTTLAHRLASLAGPGAILMAAGRRNLYRVTRQPLTAAGYVVLSGGRRTNGADRALLAEAARLYSSGRVERFIVASNDHAFRRLPSVPLTVVTQSPAGISQRLLAAASDVVTVDVRALCRSIAAVPSAPSDGAADAGFPRGPKAFHQ